MKQSDKDLEVDKSGNVKAGSDNISDSQINSSQTDNNQTDNIQTDNNQTSDIYTDNNQTGDRQTYNIQTNDIQMNSSRANDTQAENCCCCHKTKERSEKEYKDLVNRLSRIEGQISGIKRMVEKDAYCIDILTQVAAANAALNSFTKVLLANHIKTCVARDIKDGKEETIDELVKTLQKLMK